MNIRLDAFICYTELVPDCALGEAFEYDRSTNILLLERVYAGGPGLDAAMLCFGNRLVGVNEASIPYNRNILSSFAAGSYALEYDHCGRQVAKYCCGMMDSEITEFASVCRTASLTTSADEYDRGGYALSLVPMAWPGDVVWAKYYDGYDFVSVRGLGAAFAFEATAAAPAYAFAKGLLTGMYTGAGHEVYYYDGVGREIQRYATGFNRGRRSSVYNYDGSLARQTFSYPPGSGLGDMEKVYTHDRCGRLVSSVVRVSKALRMDTTLISLASSSSLASLPGSAISPSSWAEASLTREYDAIGRLARVNHGSGAAVTSYGYDVHGWIVSQSTAMSSGKTVSYALEYAPCFNGNVARRVWAEGAYSYQYDNMNRLSDALFSPGEGSSADFTVSYAYDSRGNITDIMRNGVIDRTENVETFGELESLTYTYDGGNHITSLSVWSPALPFDGIAGLHCNGGFDMTYNAAGDLVRDTSRGVLRCLWNADGHPMQYDLEGGHRHYLYWDGLGNHLYTSYETAVTPPAAGQIAGRTRRTSVRAYSGDGHVLRGGAGNSAADTLEMLRFAGGYFDANLVPHYYVTDYLGSNIAVIRSDGALVQSATYYPYGTPHRAPKNLTAVSTTNSYLFGGKELMTQDALDEYLYGARTYLPAATIFSSIDPLCEKYYHLSPYVFCAANPIRYVDPSGARIFLSQDMNLKQIFTVLLDLQRLTDDKLVYQTQSDGRRMIKIAKLGKGKHTKGTQLIRNLNSSFRSVEIEYDKASLDRTGKYTSRFRTYYEDGVNLKNKSNGIGVNALINYAPSQNVKTRTAASTPKGYAFRSSPTRVSLAHELIHAYHATKGDVETTTAENPTYIINGKKVVVSGNVAHKELRTVGLGFNHQGDITENDIRIEQGLPLRVAY